MDTNIGILARTGNEEDLGAVSRRPALPRHAFFGGRIVPYAEARVGVLTQALNYGTAVFAGLRAYWSAEEEELFVFRPRDHFERFLESAKLLGMRLPYSEESLVEALLELLRKELYREDCYIRPLAYYSDEAIGVGLGSRPEVSIVVLPYGPYLRNEEAVHATISSWRRVDDNMIPARGKIAGAYVNSALAKNDALAAGFDEAIVLGGDGHVSEASAANFFLVRRGVVATPPLTQDILEGITRRTVIELLRKELGRQVEERPIDRSEIYLAEEAFFCGTGVQVAAITRVDHRPIGSGMMGPVVRDLRSLFFDVVRAKRREYRGWCAPVYSDREAFAGPAGGAANLKSAPARR
jgi:branched-chain amino acid aminotransferase